MELVTNTVASINPSLMEQPAAPERDADLDADAFTSVLFGHAAFQYLHAGCELRIFEMLGKNAQGLARLQLASATGLADRPLSCLLLGLTALRLIHKRGERYVNAPLIQSWIDKDRWSMIHDTVMFEAHIVYSGQADFVESLRTDRNVGLRHTRGDGKDLYHRLAAAPDLQRIFYSYMSSWSRMSIPSLLQDVDFNRWSRLLDVGGGDATTAIAMAKRFGNVNLSVLDLPGNADVARKKIAAEGLGNRIDVVEGDMFAGPLPSGYDCIVFIHQLVIWPPEVIASLLEKAYAALAPGGSVVIFSSISDDSGDGPLMAALDSVYFIAIPAQGGMIHPWRVYENALTRAGFSKIEKRRCKSWTPHGIVVATK